MAETFVAIAFAFWVCVHEPNERTLIIYLGGKMITFQFNHICTHNIFIKSLLSFDKTCPKAFVSLHNNHMQLGSSNYIRSFIVIIFMRLWQLIRFIWNVSRSDWLTYPQELHKWEARDRVHAAVSLSFGSMAYSSTHDVRCYYCYYYNVQEQPINCVAKSPFVLAAKWIHLNLWQFYRGKESQTHTHNYYFLMRLFG